jgi:hypothetical protein
MMITGVDYDCTQRSR